MLFKCAVLKGFLWLSLRNKLFLTIVFWSLNKTVKENTENKFYNTTL